MIYTRSKMNEMQNLFSIKYLHTNIDKIFLFYVFWKSQITGF